MNHTNSDPYVSISGLTKVYRADPALDNVSLDIARGECLTLLGPSGSGKSTLLKLLAGFETSTSGSIKLAGEEITGLSPAERECGMVFQNYALFPHLTVAGNIEYGLKIRRKPKAEREQRVQEMLELVGLSGFGDRKPSQLSGGQQQRVAIARALAYAPPLLLMDEPLGALDRSLRLELVEQIRRIHRETGTTLVYVTHDQQEALALSDRIAIMRNARIVECDTPQRLYRAPKSDFVATFFGDANLLDVTSRDAESGVEIELAGSRLDLGPIEVLPSRIALRPRAFQLVPVGAPVNGLRIGGTVQDTLFLGDEVELVVELNGSRRLKVMLPDAEARQVEIGSSIELEVARQNVIPLGSGSSIWTSAVSVAE